MIHFSDKEYERFLVDPWSDAQEIKEELTNDGWVTPDTYTNCFEPISRGPAVYLFLLLEQEKYRRGMVAYVGQSKFLSQRLASHNILPELDAPGIWPMRWFKHVDADQLLEVERHYITHFDPRWNIIGRTRGVAL